MKRELNARANGLAKGTAYGEYEKKKKLTTPNNYLVDVNIDAEEGAESNVLEDT